MKFWEIRNKANEIPEILIYGDIGEGNFFDEDIITPKQFNEDLNNLGEFDEINIRINSQGGNVFSGNAIYTILKRQEAIINVYIDGIAASIASLIAMAGDNIYMPRNTMMLLHNPWMITQGNANDFREAADRLDKIRETMITAYQDKSGLEEEKIIEILDKETMLTAEEAVELGLADILEEYSVAASIENDYLIMNKVKFELKKDNLKKIVAKLKTNKGVKKDMDKFKVFDTEKEYQSALEDYKMKLKEDEDFVQELREGYIEVGEVLNKFSNLDLSENATLDDVVENVDKIKSELEDIQNQYEEYKKEVKNEKLFNERRIKLEKVGVEIKDEDKEEIIALSEKAFNLLVESNKEKMDNQPQDKKDEDIFDPNLQIYNDVDDDTKNIIKSFQ